MDSLVTPGVPVLAAEGLTKIFPLPGRGRSMVAVEEVSFEVPAGSTLGLVGESGSGKSTTGRMLTGMTPPTSGRVHLDGNDLLSLPRRRRREAQKAVQMVFQDPYASLDPRMRVGSSIAQPLRVASVPREERRAVVRTMMERVGLSPHHAARYPHEFSGGQRQRIAIARALAAQPRVLVLDEAVSALDVSIQAQILNLLAEIKRDTGLSFVFISHDLSVIRHVSDEVCVMQQGRIVERGHRDTVFTRPQHEYTRHLLGSIPSPDPRNRRIGPPLADGAPVSSG